MNVIILGLLLVEGAGSVPNLLLNPNFELVDSTGYPLNWSKATVFSRTTAEHVPNATAALEYRNSDPAVFTMAVQNVPAGVHGGYQYTLSASIKAAGLNVTAFGGGATICATWNVRCFRCGV
jgi:hypothetical protein